MANYGLSAAVEEEDYKPPSTWDKLAAGLGQSSWGTWTMAMGSSLAVSLCSLICLIILPFILREGQTPSEGVVRILTGFGAGAMVGDAFLHQLPHAFNSGGAHSHGGHTHDHGHDEAHGHDHGSGGHAHSIQDLSVGLAVLVGLIVFFLVEKAVRYVEEATAKNPELANQISFQKQHSHKHGAKGHSHYDDHTEHADGDAVIVDKDSGAKAETVVKESSSTPSEGAKKRKSSKSGPGKDAAIKESVSEKEAEKEPAAKDITVTADAKKGPAVAPGSLLVLGYLNLFSDGVHNFTDGMALGAAFVHHGAVGGWSRTLFMLAHELPQEVGDFGILVRAGFSVTKALALNFLSASMAMAGTALALVVGGDASNSSIIEGFTAGGFVYIAVAGVMPDLHAQGTSGWVTVQQVSSMLAGMGVALAISLCE
ncbi:ZIP metal ion transporter family [Klebsormidium nitens]|uniref:ZIP metal ion transporter family n=1 Tax=Klebsormidium nitens TaxID=105231 RepID=A0A1Y1IIQ9_KLENI|nr:ZIP metal ion transporter family [Klebsormidium nitens]|eukprot:GAQ89972.1 ZIP metal ion transporter family [Klebsormidium nitens]